MKRMIQGFCSLSVAGLLTACATQPDVVDSRLDSTTGSTVMALDKPLILARSAPGIAHVARDYLHLGPVELNRRGLKERFLWVGLASTVDRAPLGVAPLMGGSLTVVVDGAPMHLALKEDADTLPAAPYETPVQPYAQFLARVSLDQIALIAGADRVEVHLIVDADDSRSYSLFKGAWPYWANFSSRPIGMEGSAEAMATLE